MKYPVVVVSPNITAMMPIYAAAPCPKRDLYASMVRVAPVSPVSITPVHATESPVMEQMMRVSTNTSKEPQSP